MNKRCTVNLNLVDVGCVEFVATSEPSSIVLVDFLLRSANGFFSRLGYHNDFSVAESTVDREIVRCHHAVSFSIHSRMRSIALAGVVVPLRNFRLIL